MGKIIIVHAVLLLGLAGCKKSIPTQSSSQPAPTSPSPSSTNVQMAACNLLTYNEIEALQGSPIKETKSSERSVAKIRMSQCYFAAEELSKSVSLTLTQTSSGAAAGAAKESWERSFGEYGDSDANAKRERPKRDREEEKSNPPTRVDGVGDEAFWVGSRVGGELYVRKGDAFIRISLGGPDPVEKKMENSKVLAQKAIARL
jgi:hypothetical protein